MRQFATNTPTLSFSREIIILSHTKFFYFFQNPFLLANPFLNQP
nr:MAG TPA: hypothetical protein [Caudoviricetes sp.]